MSLLFLISANRIPFGVIFGGTDINEDIKNEEKYRVMGAVLEDARYSKRVSAYTVMLLRIYVSQNHMTHVSILTSGCRW